MSDSFTVPLSLPRLFRQPLVSVLMASYNYAHFIGEALESLLAQTYPHFEVVVCDDGSTDDSRRVIERYVQADARFYLVAKPNGGVASALNAAYRASRGEVVCVLDADDAFDPAKIERVVEAFRRRSDTGMLLHAMQVVDAEGQGLRQIPFLDAFEEGWLAETVRRRGGRWRSMPTSALCFRRSVAEHLFPIPEATFRSEADGFLNTLAPCLTNVKFLPEPLASYRLHGTNLTGTVHLDRAVAVRHLDALRRKVDAVNDRLVQLGLPSEALSVEDNVNYHEHTLALALFDGAPPNVLLRRYSRLARALLADDLYALPRKLIGLFVYGMAVLLPREARARWLDQMLVAPRLRGWWQQIRNGEFGKGEKNHPSA